MVGTSVTAWSHKLQPLRSACKEAGIEIDEVLNQVISELAETQEQFLYPDSNSFIQLRENAPRIRKSLLDWVTPKP